MNNRRRLFVWSLISLILCACGTKDAKNESRPKDQLEFRPEILIYSRQNIP